MFTGIVRALGRITKLIPQGSTLSLCVNCPNNFLDNVELGASISLDGICLTVTKVEGNYVWFDAIEETLNKTTLGHAQENDIVHLERSAKLGDEVGGHLLSGHIMGTGTITHIEKPCENTRILRVACAPEIMQYLFPKGYIALDGASLTLVDVQADSFTVHLIPETIEKTHFGKKSLGDQVNVEIDSATSAIVLSVQRWLEHHHARDH